MPVIFVVRTSLRIVLSRLKTKPAPITARTGTVLEWKIRNNGNRKLLKKRYDEKIDNVAALLDAWVAYKLNKEAFE